MDISEIKKKYADRTLFGLKEILNDLDGLRLDAVTALRDEFVKRDEMESAEQVNIFLKASTEAEVSIDERHSQARQFIKDELEKGQSIQVIKLELMDQGINIFDIINREGDLELEIIEEVTKAKFENKSNKEISEQLDANYQITPETHIEIQKKIRRKGSFNMIFGILAILIGGIAVLSFFVGKKLLPSGFFILSVGIFFTTRGIVQRRKNE